MTIQRRFAPISGRFEPERVAGFAGISIIEPDRKKYVVFLENLELGAPINSYSR